MNDSLNVSVHENIDIEYKKYFLSDTRKLLLCRCIVSWFNPVFNRNLLLSTVFTTHCLRFIVEPATVMRHNPHPHNTHEPLFDIICWASWHLNVPLVPVQNGSQNVFLRIFNKLAQEIEGELRSDSFKTKLFRLNSYTLEEYFDFKNWQHRPRGLKSVNSPPQ